MPGVPPRALHVRREGEGFVAVFREPAPLTPLHWVGMLAGALLVFLILVTPLGVPWVSAPLSTVLGLLVGVGLLTAFMRWTPTSTTRLDCSGDELRITRARLGAQETEVIPLDEVRLVSLLGDCVQVGTDGRATLVRPMDAGRADLAWLANALTSVAQRRRAQIEERMALLEEELQASTVPSRLRSEEDARRPVSRPEPER